MKSHLLRKEGLQLVVLALPFVLATALWNKLPDRIVTHWDLHNQPNGWMPKAAGLLVPPAINVLVTALIAFVPRIAPRLLHRGEPVLGTGARLRRVWRWLRLVLSTFVAGICMVAASAATGWRLDVGWACSMGGLVLLVVCGNFLANLEPNYLFGIRTPWTLEDPTTWRATHRLGSRVMVFGALALLLVGAFVPGAILTGLLLGFVFLLTLGSLGYSAWFYQRRAVR